MLYKFRCALARFMYGRNGVDALNRALVWGYLILWGLEIVFGLLNLGVLAWVARTLVFVLIVVVLFRMFSKNLPRRREENRKWMNWWQARKNAVAGAKARHADTAHKYFTCKTCKTICRVPVGKGKIVITCPKCGAKISAKT
ncbi:MAG: hypothetical protein E7429_00495 [Ruminococcaceae bacterium]|nr:hypothetical protein [Oscillospiraceae bacterium]